MRPVSTPLPVCHLPLADDFPGLPEVHKVIARCYSIIMSQWTWSWAALAWTSGLVAKQGLSQA